MTDITVLYHANCNDGLFAAAAAYASLGPDKARYIPIHYTEAPPEPVGHTLFLVDFSFNHPVMLEQAAHYERIVVLDHHKSAEKELTDPKRPLPENVEVTFDMEKSGARLAWEFFFPESEKAPGPILLVEDRDLWRFNYGEPTYHFNAGLYHHKPSVEECARMLVNSNTALEGECFADGKVLYEAQQMRVKRIAAKATPDTDVDFLGYRTPLLNLTIDISETLYAVLNARPDIPFAASYFDIPAEGKRVYSLRSMDDRMDVSEIARSLGGGGHRNAAGFVSKLPKQVLLKSD